MKYYNKEKNIYYYGGSMTMRVENNKLFSGIPSVEQLTQWGFEEIIEPPYEPTEEELLQEAKQRKIAELMAYDGSEAVNSFSIGGQSMWLSVEERQQIATQIAANEAVGRETMTRWFGGHSFTFPIDAWRQMLMVLEVYCGDAINTTEGHRAAIEGLDSVEAVESYDYMVGYPEKLLL